MFQAISQFFSTAGLILLGIIIGGAGMFIWLAFTGKLKK